MNLLHQIKWPLIYLLLSLSYLYCLKWLPYPFDFLHKTLPIVVLGLYAWRSLLGIGRIFIIAAVICSATGDVLLALPMQNGFIFGLSAFFLAHVFYLANFSRFFQWQTNRAPLVLALITAVIVLMTFLLPVLDNMLLPVLCYVLVIMLMAGSAIFAARYQTAGNQLLLLLGALSFVLSDAMIAWNKFIGPVSNSAVLIMGSYYLAQYCLVTAATKMEHIRIASPR